MRRQPKTIGEVLVRALTARGRKGRMRSRAIRPYVKNILSLMSEEDRRAVIVGGRSPGHEAPTSQEMSQVRGEGG